AAAVPLQNAAVRRQPDPACNAAVARRVATALSAGVFLPAIAPTRLRVSAGRQSAARKPARLRRFPPAALEGAIPQGCPAPDRAATATPAQSATAIASAATPAAGQCGERRTHAGGR